MHICFASINYHKHKSGGGVGTYVQILGRTLVRLGHKVSVIAFDSDLEGSVNLSQCLNHQNLQEKYTTQWPSTHKLRSLLNYLIWATAH